MGDCKRAGKAAPGRHALFAVQDSLKPVLLIAAPRVFLVVPAVLRVANHFGIVGEPSLTFARVERSIIADDCELVCFWLSRRLCPTTTDLRLARLCFILHLHCIF